MKTIITRLEPEYYAPAIIEACKPEIDAFLHSNVFLGGGTAGSEVDYRQSPHPFRGRYTDDYLINTTGTVRRVICVPDEHIHSAIVLQGVNDALEINLLAIEVAIPSNGFLDGMFKTIGRYVVSIADKDMNLVRNRILKFSDGVYDISEEGYGEFFKAPADRPQEIYEVIPNPTKMGKLT